jgi:hypothetical protein
VLKVIADDVPAAWVYAPAFVYAAHRRFDHVVIRPESSWLALWQWSVRPGEQLPRDREGSGAR